MRASSLAVIGSLLLAATARAETVDTDWCTIETPAMASPGALIEIKVTLKTGVEPAQLAADLHWMKKNGMFGGMLSWTPRKDARNGGVFTFKHNPKLTNEMGSISPLVFLSPDGDYKNRTKTANGKKILVAMDPATAAATAATEARHARPETVTFKRSMLQIVPPAGSYGPGDEFDVTVNYKLDAADAWGDGTQIRLMALGPWIDNPDGTYTKDRHHVGIPGLGNRTVAVEPGSGSKTFHYKVGSTFRYNDLAWMVSFMGGDGKAWPWSVRASGPALKAVAKGFDLSVERPGGLFTYAEPVVVHIAWQKEAVAGASKTIKIRLTDAAGREADALEKTLVAGAPGTGVDLPLPGVTARGVLLVEATIEGWGTRSAFLARIPDVLAITGGKPTPFGATNIGDRDLSHVARMLGLTFCRHFVNWVNIQPQRDVWSFDRLDAMIDGNVKEGMIPWICLVDPPSWILPPGVSGAGYEPFPFDAAAWRDSITVIARRYQDRIWGFEWLNEIVPGNKSTQPVQDYLAFCRIGTEAVKAVNPKLQTQLAGGLWPRNFRTDLLAQGIAQTLDVLPLHYNALAGMVEARQDLDAVGAGRVAVWDNESAAGLSVWDMPTREALTRSALQSQWVLQHWPDELVGGAKTLIYFGGWPQAAGNWTYLLDAHTPRPVAATLAVLSSKLAQAKPVGKFFAGTNGVFHLFENAGRAVLVAAAATDAGATVALPVGADAVVQTDNQGNETRLEASKGVLTLTLRSMPVFIEGANLDALKAQVVPGIGEDRLPASVPSVMVVKDERFIVPLQVRNPLEKPLSGSIAISVPGGWAAAEPVAFNLPAGGNARLQAVLAPTAAGAVVPSHADLAATVTFRSPALPAVEKPFSLTVVRPEDLGNLLKNGAFETAGSAEDAPASWSGNGKRALADDGLGGQTHVLRFDGNGAWQHEGQTLDLPAPGQGYLYTAWVWSHDMEAGSNMQLEKADGTTELLTIPKVFSAGNGTPFWRLLAHRSPTAANVRRISFQPVTKGAGWTLYDNLRVTLDEGTDFAAEALRAPKAIKIDGTLAAWNLACPIPLLCDNQLTVLKPGYTWMPANLAGVAYLNWDAQALYFAARVRDDKAVAATTGEQTLEGDSLCLAIHPANRAPGTDARACCWYISAASPGGGSGRYTLYRPPAHSGGLTGGQLAQNSSLYEMAIVRTGDVMTYTVKIPWADTGCAAPGLGTKLGLSLQLNDNDGDGRAAAMTWGGGLHPAWSPSNFGVLTLVAP